MLLPSYIRSLDAPVIAPVTAHVAAEACVQLWRVSLDVVLGQHDLALLSPVEQAHAARLHFEHDARRYRVSHVALRLILAQALGINDPATVSWQRNAHGKPHLASGALHFNMSHSGDWGLIGICVTHPIGVDLEMINEPMRDAKPKVEVEADPLAQRHFAPAEYAAYLARPHDERHALFWQTWTRKEACLKALGSGLSTEPRSFEVGIHAGQQTTTIASAQGPRQLEVVSLSWPAAAAALALLSPY